MVDSNPLITLDPAQLLELCELQRFILDSLPIGVTVYSVCGPDEWRISFINNIAIGNSTPDPSVALAMSLSNARMEEVLPLAIAAQVRHHFQNAITTNQPVVVEDRYELEIGVMWAKSTFSAIRDQSGKVVKLLAIWENITERKLREAEERQRQEEIIAHQQATLAELSTPMLSINEKTVVMPLVGTVDSRRIQQIMDTLLNGVAENHSTIVILDITGVPIVDTQVANVFLRASQAVNLLGAQVVLTGIRPEVAQTLVGLGVDLRGIITRSTLRDGIAYALSR